MLRETNGRNGSSVCLVTHLPPPMKCESCERHTNALISGPGQSSKVCFDCYRWPVVDQRRAHFELDALFARDRQGFERVLALIDELSQDASTTKPCVPATGPLWM